MTIGLDQQPESILCPLRRIDGLSAIKILQSFLVFADVAVNLPARPECDRLRIKLNHHIEISKSALRLTKLHPGKMATEVSMRIARIICNPFGHNLKMALWIGSQETVQYLDGSINELFSA